MTKASLCKHAYGSKEPSSTCVRCRDAAKLQAAFVFFEPSIKLTGESNFVCGHPVQLPFFFVCV
jgi:hypothetical protein